LLRFIYLLRCHLLKIRACLLIFKVLVLGFRYIKIIRTVEERGSKSVDVLSSGHDKSRFTSVIELLLAVMSYRLMFFLRVILDF
jgi:hypothetical protein